jgi:hypothetical protein
MALMTDMESWFYSGDEEVFNKATIENKSKDLNDIGSKVYKRFYDWGKLGDAFAKFESTVNSSLNTFNERFAIFNSGAGSLNKQELEDIEKLISAANNQLNEWRTQSTSYLKHLDCPVSHENVSKQADELAKVFLLNFRRLIISTQLLIRD